METVFVVFNFVGGIIILGCILLLIGWMMALNWGPLHLIDDNTSEFGSSPIDEIEFPNFDVFKKKVKEIEEKDVVTRNYLFSRRIRLHKIQNERQRQIKGVF